MKTFIFLTFSFSLLVACNSTAQPIKGTFAIKNVQTGMLLRIKDANKKDGTPLVAYNPINWKCMTWDFLHVSGNTYQLKNLLTGKTFVTADANYNLQQTPLVKGLAAQEYEFVPVSKDVYQIKSKESGLYVTGADDKGAVNSAIILAPENNSKLQQWTIYLQDPVM